MRLTAGGILTLLKLLLFLSFLICQRVVTKTVFQGISILTIGVSGFSINYNPIVKGSPEKVSNPVVVTNRGLHVFGFGHSRNR